MAYYYIKLYHEILDDPKMGRLSDHLYRRVIELFLMAGGERNRDGYLPSVEDIAWKLRSSIEEMQSDLEAIEQTGIIRHDDTGWMVVNFAKRQDAATGAERIKQYRKREVEKQFTELKHDSNDIETKRYIESESELKLNIDINDDGAKSGQVYRAYEQNIGIITPMISDKIDLELKECPQEWILKAIELAVNNQARNWAYIAAILKRWKDDGQMTINKPPPKSGKNGSKPSPDELAKTIDENMKRVMEARQREQRTGS